MADQNVVRNKQRGHKSRPTPRDLLMAVAIGIAGSVVTVSVSYLQLAASAVHVYLVAATLGLWALICVLPLLIVRVPGASVVACLAMGIVCAVTTPFGPAAIGTLLLEGIIVELPFLVTRYRQWSAGLFTLSSVIVAAFLGWLAPQAVGVQDPSVGMCLICAVIAAVGSVVFLAGGFWLDRRLVAAGVVERSA